MSGTLSRFALADLSAHPFHGRLSERWSLLGRDGDPQGPLLDDTDFAWHGLDLNLPFLDSERRWSSEWHFSWRQNTTRTGRPEGAVR